mmetsp:Transcript_17757/g.25604  ORF Transcript_17757/g.25604 Transcript_17757/m.25604 type:complete len:256 (-) Transcript_17757:413-1180(-)
MCWSFIRMTGVLPQILLSRSDFLLLLQRPMIGSCPASDVAISMGFFRFPFILHVVIANAFLYSWLRSVIANLRSVFNQGLGRFAVLVLFVALFVFLLPLLLPRLLSNRDFGIIRLHTDRSRAAVLVVIECALQAFLRSPTFYDSARTLLPKFIVSPFGPGNHKKLELCDPSKCQGEAGIFTGFWSILPVPGTFLCSGLAPTPSLNGRMLRFSFSDELSSSCSPSSLLRNDLTTERAFPVGITRSSLIDIIRMGVL